MNKLADRIREGKIKRAFRTRYKMNYAGLVSHITQRATGKEPLFLENNDYLFMLSLLKEVSDKYNLQIFAFALMTNHVHLLLRQKEANLPQAMHNLFNRYARYFNWKYGRKGHVFGGRYRQAACFDDHYLIAASIYIHLNPVRAGIVENYSAYRWTTWRLYCSANPPKTFVDWKFILFILNCDLSQARRRYKGLLRRAAKYPLEEALEKGQTIGKFGAWLKKQFPGLLEGSGESIQQVPLIDGYTSDSELDSIINDLRGKKRLLCPEDKKARRFAVEQLKTRGFSPEEIAEYLTIARITVYRILAGKA